MTTTLYMSIVNGAGETIDTIATDPIDVLADWVLMELGVAPGLGDRLVVTTKRLPPHRDANLKDAGVLWDSRANGRAPEAVTIRRDSAGTASIAVTLD